jgi:hypothetical protein
LKIFVEIQPRGPHSKDSPATPGFHIYVRREGQHFVGLCTELRAIIEGQNFEQVVEKATRLIAKAFPGRSSLAMQRLVVYGDSPNQQTLKGP